ncbi:MAG: hypothetical protein IKP47_09430 [Ruminococcus sp.]|nr:hypothetical protein [Ruminococcus sp.]
MKVRREDFPITSDDELRKIYRARVKQRKLISAPPLFFSAVCALIFWIAGYFQQTVFNPRFSNPVLPVLIPIAFFLLTFISGMLMFTDNAEKHLRSAIYITMGQFIVFAAGMYFGLIKNIPFVLMAVCMTLTCGGHILMIVIINDLNALRECPSFPFDNYRRELTRQSGDLRTVTPKAASVDLEALYDKSSELLPKRPQSGYDDDFFQQHDMQYLHYMRNGK